MSGLTGFVSLGSSLYLQTIKKFKKNLPLLTGLDRNTVPLPTVSSKTIFFFCSKMFLMCMHLQLNWFLGFAVYQAFQE